MRKKMAIILTMSLILSMASTTFMFAASNKTTIQYASSNLYEKEGAKSQPVISGFAKSGKKFQVYRSTTKKGKYKLVKTLSSSEKSSLGNHFRYKGAKTSGMHFYKVRSVNGKTKGAFSDSVAIYSCGGNYVSKTKDEKTDKYIYKFLINNTGKSTSSMTVSCLKRWDFDQNKLVSVDMVDENGEKISKVSVTKNSKKYIYIRDSKVSEERFEDNFYELLKIDVKFKGSTYNFSAAIYRDEFLMNNAKYST